MTHEQLFKTAKEAGTQAGRATIPHPMTVSGITYAEGLCGFASVNIADGRSSFAKWLKKNDLASKSYTIGVDIYVDDFGQSYDRKKACADAMAKVFHSAGIPAESRSNLD